MLPDLQLTPVQHTKDTLPTVLGQGNWLQLERISYKDNQHIERTWERCIRKTSTSSQDGKIGIGVAMSMYTNFIHSC